MVNGITTTQTPSGIISKINEIIGELVPFRNYDRFTETIDGTQTGVTGSWTGITQDTALVDGKNIHYFLPYAGSGNATLNLTLAGGTTTGAKPVYRWGTSYVTTHYPANSCISMTFNARKDAWFVDADYDTNDWANRLCYNNNIYAVEAITAGKLICGNKNGYKNVASGVTFDISYPILYAEGNIIASANGSNNSLARLNVNLQNTKASWTGTQKSVVYLVGTLSGTTFTIDSSVFTTTVPTTADGKVYIPLGILYSTYQIYFVSCKDLYAYRNGSFQLLQPDLSSKANTDGSNMVSSVKNFDGQWVMNSLQIADGATIPTSSDTSYSLASYLPDDGYIYEVLFGATCTTTSTSGSYLNVILHTDIITTGYAYVCGARTRTSSTHLGSGSVVLPVGSGRSVSLNASSGYTGTYRLYVVGYRRLGTNS